MATTGAFSSMVLHFEDCFWARPEVPADVITPVVSNKHSGAAGVKPSLERPRGDWWNLRC
jgi:hypothetical protein